MWKVVSSQVTGASHLKTNLSCQDRVAYEALPGCALVAAVADGAGSAQMAELGAEIAANFVIAHLKHSLTEKRSDFAACLREAAALAREAIAFEAGREKAPMRSYATTLLALVLTPEGGGALQLGDGLIVVSDCWDEWSWVFWPQRGEYINTTHFLTDDDAMERLEIDILPGALTDVALMSDGLEPLALHYATRAIHVPFLNGIFRPLFKAKGSEDLRKLSTSLQKFLSSEVVGSRTDDDLSLLLATRRNDDESQLCD
ncbi:MAG: protein phosphatase 2C domain-containing protein [Candidatus Eisenbacteria bacterium]|nr:protein phosphatase 2C domain-containing protein [Candidatus Eisenbacteria bacterium]MBU1947546.1 protein phosphatase 2C domain-containing protein [Candidatus Eisenbacteria bacterium]